MYFLVRNDVEWQQKLAPSGAQSEVMRALCGYVLDKRTIIGR
jgi:hypothetical protein